MRWLVFAVFSSLYLGANTELQLKDGAVFNIPDAFFNGVSWQSGDRILVANNKTNDVLFFYGQSNEDSEANIVEHAKNSGLLKVLESRGLLGPEFDTIPKEVNYNGHFVFILQDRTNSDRNYHLILAQRRSPNGVAVFMMVGAEPEFSTHVSDFTKMVNTCQFRSRYDEQVTLQSFGIAGLFLVLNLAFIGYGFQKISQLRSLKLSEE